MSPPSPAHTHICKHVILPSGSSFPLAPICSIFTFSGVCDPVLDVADEHVHNVPARFREVSVSARCLLFCNNPETFHGGLDGDVGDYLRLVADFNLFLVYNLNRQNVLTKVIRFHGSYLISRGNESKRHHMPYR